MLVARHRSVPAVLIVDAAECHLVEPVDVDHEIERLPDGQEIAEHEKLLRLFVALMTEAQCDGLPVVERSASTQAFLEPRRAEPAEIRADPTSENPDDELAIVGFGKGIMY